AKVSNYSGGVIPTTTAYYRKCTVEKDAALSLAGTFGIGAKPRFVDSEDASPGLIIIVDKDYDGPETKTCWPLRVGDPRRRVCHRRVWFGSARYDAVTKTSELADMAAWVANTPLWGVNTPSWAANTVRVGGRCPGVPA